MKTLFDVMRMCRKECKPIEVRGSYLGEKQFDSGRSGCVFRDRN
ncbi:MAG: hypothetical protein UHS47_09010 [Oscillospiraceae bacterium]|nr:hypothetical protein [Oscillospiraceae bacterium]